MMMIKFILECLILFNDLTSFSGLHRDRLVKRLINGGLWYLNESGFITHFKQMNQSRRLQAAEEISERLI